MDHGIKFLKGRKISDSDWSAFVERLRRSANATSKVIAQVRQARDFDVAEEKEPAWKHYQGDFEKRIQGVRTVESLAEDLVVCFVHVDITKDVELATGRQLTQVYTSYSEREARSANPRKYDKPFYIRWFPEKPGGNILVFTPSGLPRATEYALENEVLRRIEADLDQIPSELPEDPLPFLEQIFRVNRLDRIQSVVMSAIREEGQPPAEIRQAFLPDAGSLADFRNWLNRQRRENFAVNVLGVRFSVMLEDLEGRTFEVILRPRGAYPIGLSVSQKSDARGQSYRLLSDIVRNLLTDRS